MWCLKPLTVGSFLTQPEMIKTNRKDFLLGICFEKGWERGGGKGGGRGLWVGTGGRWLSGTQRWGSLGLARRAVGAAGSCGMGGAWDLDWPL